MIFGGFFLQAVIILSKSVSLLLIIMPIGDYCCQHMELSYHQASKYNQNPVWSLWSGLTKFTNFGH